MGIYRTDSSFREYNANPFNNSLPYDDSWILLKLMDTADDFQQMTTGGNGQVFRFIMTKELKDWTYRVCDFIQYESVYNKNIILAINEGDLNTARAEYGNHKYNDPFLRDYEQQVLVHTTTRDKYEKILLSEELKSWKTSKAEYSVWEEAPIGALLGDPESYSSYVMFGTGGVYQELIPLAKQRGYIDMNLDGLYTAGARFYFDAAKIANDGLLVRDGVHQKVKERLNLIKYLLWTATSEELGVAERTTPRIFAETADRIFSERFGMRVYDTSY